MEGDRYLIIDKVSMISADLLHDNQSFGGVNVIEFGDSSSSHQCLVATLR
jgi:hypothetical protein